MSGRFCLAMVCSQGSSWPISAAGSVISPYWCKRNFNRPESLPLTTPDQVWPMREAWRQPSIFGALNTPMVTHQKCCSTKNSLTLVTCRHSLQIFNRPELILKELYRICKPGGRVYITNEKNSHCLGEPRSESIQWTYNEVAKLFEHFEMDVELGPKSRRYLTEAGFDDIRVEVLHGHEP